MTGRFKDQVAFVTGAAKGIGRAIAERFASEGACVVAADSDADAAAETVAALASAGGRAVFQLLDVRDAAAAKTAVDHTVQRFGRLDIHVNNAGIVNRAPFLAYGLDAWRSVLDVNLTGAFICGQASARAMAAGGRGGRIINIASISGQQGGTGRAAYGVTKAGIINLTQTMAMELAQHAVTVNAVAPGPTQVPRLSHGPKQRAAFLSRMALKRYATPQDVAAAVAFLASPDAAFITGHVLNVDGGFAAAGVLFDPSDEI